MVEDTVDYYCGNCHLLVTDDCIECSLCNRWVHRQCAKLSKRQLKDKSNMNVYWYCFDCTDSFPFNNLSNEELKLVFSDHGLNLNLFNLHEICLDLNKDLHNFDLNNDFDDFDSAIDSGSNFYNSVNIDCQYYTMNKFNDSNFNNRGISLVHFNARSLKCNFNSICDCINNLNYSFDVIAISETWIDDSFDVNYINIDGYNLYHINRNYKKGGGVALYVKNNLKCKLIVEQSVAHTDLYECVVIELCFEKSKNVIISCIYRAPGSDLDSFSESLDTMLGHLTMNNKILYVCGDFNINLIKGDIHNATKNFIDTMYSRGLFPLISKPSRITEFSITLIDNIFTNDLENNNFSGLLITDISDHLPVFAISKHIIFKKPFVQYKYIRNVNSHTAELFTSALKSQDWNIVYNCENVNLAYTKFINIFTELYNKFCPLKKIVSKGYDFGKPWFHKGLRNACTKKNWLYKNFLKYRTVESCERYKLYKNKLTTILRASEKKYYTTLLEENKRNTKATWKILNRVIRKNKVADGYDSFKCNDSDNRLKVGKSIANGFNKFFVNIGPDLASKITTPNKSVSAYLKNGNINSMYLTGVVKQDIVNTVNKFSNKTSKDCNDINMVLLKKVITCVANPFTFICNKSLEEGVFPDEMKCAKVIPLFKSGAKDEFTNYRPVSLLPQFSKILEKIFADKLDNFTTKYNLINNSQYGFRSNSSTSMALLELIEEITNSLHDDKKSTIGVFIDLKKAFDTLNHGLLLKKLEHYGVRGIANNWICSYLENRRQFVSFNGFSSDSLKLSCGVPQGSILGPKLFLFYINDICNISDKLKFILFADDTNIFFSDQNLCNLVSTLNMELNKLNTWFAVNKLSLNVSKTNYMLFSRSKINFEIKILINDNVIERVFVTKFLGVLIDEKLKWQEHINLVRSKVVKNISVLYKFKHIFDHNALRILYCSLILPYLTYCVEVWGNSFKSHLAKIEIIQKRAVRIICGARHLEHTSKLFGDLKLLKFTDIIKHRTLLFMYKAYNNLLPVNLQKMFTVVGNAYHDTRQVKNFKCRFARTQLKAMVISVKGVKLWNSLDKGLCECHNINIFNNGIKKSILEQY